jgi:phosphoenolpyruvate-protein kinase (PTS system EI component)
MPQESPVALRTFAGLGCSPGCVVARVCWAEPGEAGTIWAYDGPLQPSIVLAARDKGALALLTKTGGLTSHGANIARELRLPVVSALSNLTEIVSAGYCECDAVSGTITLVNR